MKHKLFSKRGLALVVSVMMCLSAMSTTAWAGNFRDLQDKIDTAVQNGEESVVLDQDYTYGSDSTREGGAEDGNKTTISINDKITLNLNGWTISGNNENNNSVITVGNKGNLTLKDEKVETDTIKSNKDNAVGTITGGQGSFGGDRKTEGGGVKVTNGGTFTMNGGTITGNTVEARGGGVYVEENATFTMNDGTISGNTAGDTGGGVSLWEGGTFEMNGGEISGNNAGNVGGGVFVNSRALFNMNSGSTIKGNHATSADSKGGGVYLQMGGTFNMKGGDITENTSNNNGGGVAVWGDGKFTMTDGNISGNTANKGGGVSMNYAPKMGKVSSFTMAGGTISGNTASDVGGGVWADQKSTITMTTDGTATGSITGNTAANSGGGVYMGNNSTFTMNDGTISGNKTLNGGDRGGGGVYVDHGSFTMNSGNITSNTSAAKAGDDDTGASGGGVYMNGGTFTMENGTISGNNANGTGEGGGIYGRGSATITMNNGNITDNKASSTFGGGGVRVYGAKFTMNNGTLTGNTAGKAADNLQSIAAVKDESDPEKTEAFINAGTIGADAERFITKECKDKSVEGQITVHAEHKYGEANCAHGATCEYCSDVSGDPNSTGHDYRTTWESNETEHWHVCNNDPGHKSTPEAHTWNEGEVTKPATEKEEGVKTFTCTGCNRTKTESIDKLVPEDPTEPGTDPTEPGTDPTEPGTDPTEPGTDPTDPGTVTIPEVEPPLADEPAPAVTIADEDVPLAGLVTLAQLLDELYRHEGAPEVHIPDGFPFADHEYAEAICWGLDNALVFHTEEEPLDPDEIVTVGLMREVLTNFVAYRGVEEFTVELAGADDEIVMDLGERLVVFYAQLAEAEAAAETDETEAA